MSNEAIQVGEKIAEALVTSADKAIELVKAVASQAGMAAEKLYPYAVKECMVVGLTNMITATVLFVVSILLIGLVLKYWKCVVVKTEGMGIIPLLIGIGMFIASINIVINKLSLMLNPEYHAIQLIIDLAKSLK